MSAAAARGRRPARRWIEEYPTISLVEALKLKVQSVDVSWTRGSEDYGQGWIHVGDEQATVRCWGALLFDGGPLEVGFDLTTRVHGIQDERLSFSCPICRTDRTLLALVADAWACRECHELGYRSQYLPPVESLREQLYALKTEIDQGRQPYERRAVFEAKLARYSKLSQRLIDKSSELYPAMAKRRQIVKAEYFVVDA
jgi:ribosomal protein L37AE/L43A